jgi:hypothetical protein
LVRVPSERNPPASKIAGHLANIAEDVAPSATLRQASASPRSANIRISLSNVLTKLSSLRRLSRRRCLADSTNAPEAPILLIDKLRQNLRAKLSQRTLHVATAQSTRGGRLLQDRLFALACQRLELWALLDCTDGRSLRTFLSKPGEVLQALKGWQSAFNIRPQQFCRDVKLTALFFNAHFRRSNLSACRFACRSALNRTADKRRPAND